MAKDEMRIRTGRLPSLLVSAPAARRGPDDRTVAYDRGSARDMRYGSFVNGTTCGASSTLVDPTGNVLSKGFGHGASPYVKD
ncbi:hypothetical protein [Streptomyces sp. NPDC051561]|uniref:hypothetical protein n=1 Tax=Streptomyces sp. NPDC051561 TaxID=3365658 RepID=UPI0037B63937